jgi:hypothetical protein
VPLHRAGAWWRCVVLGRGKDGFVASLSVPLVMGVGRRAA